MKNTVVDLEQLVQENELLRQELRVAREAADINAQLVVQQFEETEKLMHDFKTANAQRKAVLDAASEVAIVAADLNGIIQVFNTGAQKLLGYRSEEIIGKKTPVLFHPEKEIQTRCLEMSRTLNRPVAGIELFLSTARRGGFRHQEWTCVRKEGLEFPVMLSITPLLGPDEALTGFLYTSTDLTQRKKMELETQIAREAAENANRTKSAFLASMSHELRTPLNAVIGYGEMLLENSEDREDAEAASDLKRILSASRYLLSLINDILDLSKIEAGKLELYLESFSVPEILQEIAITAKPLVEKKSNVLKLEIPESIGEMYSDVTRLRQILLNLLSNASKFTEGGTITLQAGRERVDGADWMQFDVSDTGIGMTPEQMAKMFQPFAQADAGTTKKFGGTGLGLVISKKFCELMGGDIELTSEYGKGTRFRVFIPAAVADGRPVPVFVQPRMEEAPVSTNGEVVLVIDDDPVVHDLMQRTLSKEGFEVRTAGSGAEGLQMARELHPIAITLDVMMPEMDGWMVLRELKADPELANIPVIMVTILEDKHTGYALGAKDFLMKPVDHDQLVRTVRKCSPAASHPILVVDDDPDARDVISRTLSKEGWTILEAENGRIALELLAEHNLSLIVLDLMMPEMDGFQFIEEYRKTDCGAPIIVITAKELMAEDQTRLNGHVNNVLHKGVYSSEQLLNEVRDSIRAGR